MFNLKSLLTENFISKPLLIRCHKNDRNSQKQLFLSLHEFAWRICYRYTNIQEDPTVLLCRGFIKLFKNIEQINFNAASNLHYELRRWFRCILIDTYIETGKKETGQAQNLSGCNRRFIPIIERT